MPSDDEIRRELHSIVERIYPDPNGLSKILARIVVRQAPPGCRCGHAWSAHQHYRAGTDCPFCMCPCYQRRIPVLRPLRSWPEHPQTRMGPQNLGGWTDLPYEPES